MTHAFLMTLDILVGVMAGLAVFVTVAQIILRFFISPTYWRIVASLITVCTLWIIWDCHQRELYRHSLKNKQERVEEAAAWREECDSLFRKSHVENSFKAKDGFPSLVA
jgi:hypothetical protein